MSSQPLSAATPEPVESLLCSVGFRVTIPADALLFMEGQPAAGIHLVASGLVKLTINSSRGRTLILRICGAGEILGVHNCLGAEPYEMTAEALQPCDVWIVRRDDFLRLVLRDPDALLALSERMGQQCHAAYELIHTLTISTCIRERLARLLLDLSVDAEPTREGRRVILGLTHEEIGQMIGTSRETVTRLLKEFRTKRLAELKGPTLLIFNRSALAAMTEGLASAAVPAKPPALAAAYLLAERVSRTRSGPHVA